MNDAEIDDIVLLHPSDGAFTPSIVVAVISPTQAQLYHFQLGGGAHDATIYWYDKQPGQWEPKH